MHKEDIDHILTKLGSSRDPKEIRRLLQQADACRPCPERHLLGEGVKDCSCLLRFRTELKNSLDNILSNKERFPRRKETW